MAASSESPNRAALLPLPDSSVESIVSGLQIPTVHLNGEPPSGKDVVREEGPPPGFEFPWAKTYEERYPVKDPAMYTEFEKKYPPDKYGDEAAENARVWKIYRDRVTDSDEDIVDGWNKTLDVLLIFAGLFSAVVTAFLIEAYKLLQPDFSEYTVTILLAAVTNATQDIPRPQDFVAHTSARWINILWFTSLSFALLVALLAILAKQWLAEYNSRMRASAASPRRWAQRHVAFNRGLTKWKLDVVISMLPVFLHIALFLFFAGLFIFLLDIESTTAYVVLAFSSAVLFFYSTTTLLPLFWGDCPTATPILPQIFALYTYLVQITRWILRLAMTSTRTKQPGQRSIVPPFAPSSWFRRLRSRFSPRSVLIRSWRRLRLAARRVRVRVKNFALEKSEPLPPYHANNLIAFRGPSLDSEALYWMITVLPARDDVNAAVDAIGSLNKRQHTQYFATTTSKPDPLFSAQVTGTAIRRTELAVSAINRLQQQQHTSGERPTVPLMLAREYANCLRAVAFLRPEGTHSSGGIQSITSGMAYPPTFDIDFLARYTGSTWIVSSVACGEKVIQYWDAQKLYPPILPSTLMNLSGLADSLADVFEMLALAINGLASPSEEVHAEFQSALSQWADVCEGALDTLVQQPGYGAAAGLARSWIPLRRRISVYWRILYQVAFVSNRGLSFDLDDRDASTIRGSYRRILRCYSVAGHVIPLEDDGLHGRQLEECLFALQWDSELFSETSFRLAAGHLIGCALARSLEGVDLESYWPPWTSTLGDITRQLLHHYLLEATQESAEAAWLLVAAASRAASCRISAFDAQIFGPSGATVLESVLNLLLSDRERGMRSAWRSFLLLYSQFRADVRSFVATEPWESAASLASGLCVVHRLGGSGRIQTTALLEELLGDDIGFQFIRQRPESRYKIAIHAKEISPEWWEETKQRLHNLPHDQWNYYTTESDDWDNSQFAVSFINKIDNVLPCRDCPPAVRFPRATHDSEDGNKPPDSPQSGIVGETPFQPRIASFSRSSNTPQDNV